MLLAIRRLYHFSLSLAWLESDAAMWQLRLENEGHFPVDQWE
jgi:hypothetical protein